jgi:hypothetical protein
VVGAFFTPDSCESAKIINHSLLLPAYVPASERIGKPLVHASELNAAEWRLSSLSSRRSAANFTVIFRLLTHKFCYRAEKVRLGL